jgi:AcrR family transcriptional regulator
MSPRSYQLGRRQEQVDESRQRVIDGARSLLAESDSYRAFTVEAVAKRADVSKATVYYQFGSKAGLLEAVCDALAAAGGMSGLPAAFAAKSPPEGLQILVRVFSQFWAVDRVVMRRLRALAALDPEVGAVIARRDDRRHSALEAIVAPSSANRRSRTSASTDQLVRTLWMLTSFETFDALAVPGRPLAEVNREIVGLGQVVMRLHEDGAKGGKTNG